MFATVRSLEIFLGLRLEKVGEKLGWIDLDTGLLHSGVYINPVAARRGLLRMYAPHTVRFHFA